MPSGGGTTRFQQLLGQLDRGNAFIYDELIVLASERLRKLTATMLRQYPRLKRWEQTDDVFQTAVMKLHRSLSEVQPQSVSHFFNLAAIQIRRTLIDLCRHHFGPEGQAVFHQSDGGQSDGGAIKRAESQNSRPESLETWTEFHESVDQLPDKEKAVFELIWYGGLEQRDVAEALGVSESTVKRRWVKAKLQLHRAFKTLAKESFDE